jgi:hypothetical protein
LTPEKPFIARDSHFLGSLITTAAAFSAAASAAAAFSVVFRIPERARPMNWKQRKAAARARATVRKLGRDRLVGGLASAAAFKATRPSKNLIRLGLE